MFQIEWNFYANIPNGSDGKMDSFEASRGVNDVAIRGRGSSLESIRNRNFQFRSLTQNLNSQQAFEEFIKKLILDPNLGNLCTFAVKFRRKVFGEHRNFKFHTH